MNAISVNDLEQVWDDDRLYAIVPHGMLVDFEGRCIPFAGPGRLCIDSRRPSDWTIIR